MTGTRRKCGQEEMRSLVRLRKTHRRAVLCGGGLLALAVLTVSSLAGAPAHAAFPGLNGRIACDGERGLPSATLPAPTNYSTSEIFSMNPDGSDFKLLTDNVGERDLDPSFSADGQRIAFDRRPVGTGTSSEVYTMNADGTGQTRITFAGANDERTAWSPDGSQIAFMAGRDGNFNIYRTRSDGSDPLGTPLTTSPGGDFSPAWSPDGSRIAFDAGGRGGDPNSEVYSMDARLGDDLPGQVIKLTNTDAPIRNWSVNWSPDGRRIVYQSTRDGTNDTPTQADDNFEIYTANPDGSGIQRLTNNTDIILDTPAINEAEDVDPAFSPDGTKIVFASARSGDREVYTMNAADGSDVRRLTNSPGFDGRCDWQPVRPAAARPRPPAPVSPLPASPFAGCPALSANVIRGTIASESINGTARPDRIFAGTGNDTVDGLAGNDCIDLGPGTDRGQGGDGDDLILGGLGRDRMSGNLGADRLTGGASGDRLIGGLGNDRLHGQSGSDAINGERGRDRINGGSANDVISAGSSGDRVAGDQGNDRINGNSGNDSLSGNSGRDRISGGSGSDRISSGAGNDRISARDGRRDQINCGSGRDGVAADRSDRVARNCERVSRRG